MKAGPCTNEEYITTIQSSKEKGTEVELVQKKNVILIKNKMKKRKKAILYTYYMQHKVYQCMHEQHEGTGVFLLYIVVLFHKLGNLG